MPGKMDVDLPFSRLTDYTFVNWEETFEGLLQKAGVGLRGLEKVMILVLQVAGWFG